jgi:hypothetical protein
MREARHKKGEQKQGSLAVPIGRRAATAEFARH